MATKTHSYSSFLRTPSQVLPDLVVGDVVLERRDEESLVVTRQDRFEAMRFGMAVSARMLRMLSKTDPESVANLMTEQMPWLGWLPTPERVECLNEILFNLDAGAETGTLEPFSRAIREWQHTAEVWADPELADRLREHHPGDGPILERPGIH